MTRLSNNTFAKCLLLLLLVQQGVGSLALAATGISQYAEGLDATPHVHDCASMNGQTEDHTLLHGGAPECSQHDHQDCIDAGCDHCVGCVACAVGFHSSFYLYMNGRPVISAVSGAAPLPEPELLYRPPIPI